MPFQFQNIIWLLFLAVIPPAYMAWRTHLRSPGVPRLMRMVSGLRAGALLALILALAGTQWVAHRHGVDLFLAIDVSHSISPADIEKAMNVARQVAAQAGAADRTAVIAFGRTAYLEEPLSHSTDLNAIESVPSKDDTSYFAALTLAMAAQEPQRNTRVLLLTDGMETKGNAEELLSQLQARSIPVDFLPLGKLPEQEVAIAQLSAPNRVGKDQPFQLRVVVEATTTSQAVLRVLRDGALYAQKTVALTAGRNIFEYTGIKEKSGVHKYDARIEATMDTNTANNAGYVTVVVEGPNRMLLVTESTSASTALVSALRQQGVQLTVASPATLPANSSALGAYAAILLHDVSALRLSQSQQAQLAAYVRDLGGGLVAVGGRNSFGLGGYFKTPLEEALPVTMDPPQTLLMPSMALALIIDRSGSMSERQGEFTKIELAKEAALSVVDVLMEQDLFGVLAFDEQSTWVVPLQKAADRSAIAQQVSLLSSGGGTDLGPAMLEALRVLSETKAMVKHVIILSDGLSLEADFTAITKQLRAAEITVSTVAVGKGADVDLLSGIAALGGGRYHFTEDARAISQIFTNEALLVSRPLAVEETFQPEVQTPAAFLSGASIRNLPKLDGYILTSPKSSAQVHLVSADGSPILTSWRYGLGRAVAFTSGATSTWAASWLKWSGFAPFWAQTTRWAMRPATQSALEPVLDISGGRGTITVDAVGKNGDFINFLDLKSEVVSPSGERQTIRLDQTAPGHYQAAFPASAQGAWVAAVSATNNAAYQQPAMAGAVLPYAAEYQLIGVDNDVPARLALRTGGTVFQGDDLPTAGELRRLYQHPQPRQIPIALWPYLLAAAFALFLLDIALRYLPTAILENVELKMRRRPMQNSEEQSPLPSAAPKQKTTTRLDDLVHSRQMAQLSSSAAAQPPRRSSVSAAAAARYLAQRRKNVQPPQEHDDAG